MRQLLNSMKKKANDHNVGIAGISYYQPNWSLTNTWFQPSMSRKFEQHTGIHARSIAEENEVELAVKAIEKLRKDIHCDLSDCAGLILACPSLIPQSVARRYLDTHRAKQEQPTRVAHKLADQLGIGHQRVIGINSFCSGYARAISLVFSKLNARQELKDNQYVLVVTANRISRITDFACQQSGALFGDLATATLIARCDSPRFAIRFEIVDAWYRKQPTNKAYFDFTLRKDVLTPTRAGERQLEASRIVFSLDGMGIGNIAPRAMASAAATSLSLNHLDPHAVQFVLPHQAGSGIVRFTQMKLEEAGFTAEVINGMTSDVGNVSSSSVPYSLKKLWSKLHGNILCPVAAVGAPGKREVSHGCLLLRSQSRWESKAA